MPSTDNPIVITSGGTYSGTWSSNDPKKPAVTIRTDELVILQNSVITSKGDLISLSGVTTGANVIIEDVTGFALDPGVAGLMRGTFVLATAFSSLTVKNCSIYGAGFGIDAVSASPATLSITNNLASDLEDRESDGQGGLLPIEGGMGHFVILNEISAASGAEIAWNQVIQTIGQTSTEDVINIYKSQGSPELPIWVHDNYIEGNSSPIGPGLAYSGAALITDGGGADYARATAYVLFTTNEVVATAGPGIIIAYGHDVTAKENRIVSCGLTKNSDWYAWGASAIEIDNYYGAPNFYNNTISGTVGGMLGIGATPHAATVHDVAVNPPDMLDLSNSVADNSFSDPCLSGKKVVLSAEDEERSYWAAKIVAFGQLIGDQHLPIS